MHAAIEKEELVSKPSIFESYKDFYQMGLLVSPTQVQRVVTESVYSFWDVSYHHLRHVMEEVLVGGRLRTLSHTVLPTKIQDKSSAKP